jgi:hypothetical protein
VAVNEAIVCFLGVHCCCVGAQAILAKNTTAATVPVRTGYLVQNWGFDIGNLVARWYPKASYAPFVEFGTAPHEIRPVNAKVLANKKTGQFFGTLVHHPGTKKIHLWKALLLQLSRKSQTSSQAHLTK